MREQRRKKKQKRRAIYAYSGGESAREQQTAQREEKAAGEGARANQRKTRVFPTFLYESALLMIYARGVFRSALMPCALPSAKLYEPWCAARARYARDVMRNRAFYDAI